MAVTFRTRGPSSLGSQMRGAQQSGLRRASKNAADIAKAQGRMAEKGSLGSMAGNLGGNLLAGALGITNPLIAAMLAGAGSYAGKKIGGGKEAKRADMLAKKMQRTLSPMSEDIRAKGRELYGAGDMLEAGALTSGLTSAGTTFALRGGQEYLTGGDAADVTNPYRFDTGRTETVTEIISEVDPADPTKLIYKEVSNEVPIFESGNVLERAGRSMERIKEAKPFKTGWGIWKSPTTGKLTGAHPWSKTLGTKGDPHVLGREFWGAAKRGRDVPSLLEYWQGKDLLNPKKGSII